MQSFCVGAVDQGEVNGEKDLEGTIGVHKGIIVDKPDESEEEAEKVIPSTTFATAPLGSCNPHGLWRPWRLMVVASQVINGDYGYEEEGGTRERRINLKKKKTKQKSLNH